jgi:predicted dehydrogenase
MSMALADDGPPLRLAIAGLTHGHIDGFLRSAAKRSDVRIVGVFDPDAGLRSRYGQKYGLADEVLFSDLDALLDRTKPEALATFTSTFDHAAVIEAAARRRVHVMVEKPLAVSNAHAARIRKAAEQAGIQVLVNYETTWYASHGEIEKLVKSNALGEVRKIVAMDGHSGPKEIGVGPEFLSWLTDPERNGAGALFDFGCYGANLMTWLLGNQRPIAVTAMVQQMKPEVYRQVDDEATVLVEYPSAQGIFQASWNWPFNRKDLEVYGKTGYAIATGGDKLRVRREGKAEEQVSPTALEPEQRDPITHLIGVVKGKHKPNELSSLANNLIVTEILEAARESARTGKRVTLSR